MANAAMGAQLPSPPLIIALDEKRFSNMAKRLDAHLAERHGLKLGQMHARTAVAKSLNFATHNELEALLENTSAGQDTQNPVAAARPAATDWGRFLEVYVNPFIALANDIVRGGNDPDDVAQGFIHAAARYLAFAVGRASAEDQMPRGVIIDDATEAFRQALIAHSSDLAGAVPSEAPLQQPHAAAPEADLTDREKASLLRVARFYVAPDVALVSFLRGRGLGELADSLMRVAGEERMDSLADVKYAHRVWAAVESGALEQSVGCFIVQAVLTPRMQLDSIEGYVKDPVKSVETRNRWARFFNEHGLYKLATMVRKDPQRLMALSEAGEDMVVGPTAGRARDAYKQLASKSTRA